MSSPLIHCLRLLWVKEKNLTTYNLTAGGVEHTCTVLVFLGTPSPLVSSLLSLLQSPALWRSPHTGGRHGSPVAAGVFLFFFIPSVHCSQKRTQTEVTGLGRVEETWTLVVHCKYELLLPFSWPVGSVSVFIIDSNVYMNHWLSGTWRKLLEYDAIETCHSFYLWWLPLFYLFCFLLCFDIA